MQTYPDKLVLRVNELHHDIGGHDEYGDLHDEIFVLEPHRWQKLLTNLPVFKDSKPLTMLDVGSGTGFVPRTVAPYTRTGDRIICSDISEGMLDECKKNVEKQTFPCSFEYLKYDGMHLPVADTSVDLLTMNSVLHHIPDTDFFLKEVKRVLKPGGYVIIGHEPNSRFYANKVIWTIYRMLYLLYHPQAITDTLARRGISRRKTIDTAVEEDPAVKRINEALLSEKLITEPLTRSTINAIVDYYSISGFDLTSIQASLSGFTLAHIETYNHLYWIYMEHHRNPFIKGLDFLLAKLFPRDGKTMMFVFKRNA